MRFSALIRAVGLAAGFTGVTTAAALPAAGASRAPVECGAPYLVARGDTLQKIAERAYGPEASYRTLHKANRALIGRDASLLEVGEAIDVPCLDAAGEPVAAETAVAEPAAPKIASDDAAPPEAGAKERADPAPEAAALAAAKPAPEMPAAGEPAGAAAPRKLRIVTATGWAPFLNQDQEEGGMLVEVLSTALSRVVGPDGFKIDFINDWNAHLDPLIADVAYDFSLAWFRPDCDRIAKLAEDSRARCRDLDWSDPLFEQVIGYYTRTDEAPPADHHALFGRALCRPAGYSTFMLEEVDLVEPNVSLKRPETPEACFEMLLRGEVDAVVIATTVADEALLKLNAPDKVAEQPQLAAIATLHAVTSVKNPRKDEQLALIDEGLRRIREDGTWFQIVTRHLIAHARRTMAGG